MHLSSSHLVIKQCHFRNVLFLCRTLPTHTCALLSHCKDSRSFYRHPTLACTRSENVCEHFSKLNTIKLWFPVHMVLKRPPFPGRHFPSILLCPIIARGGFFSASLIVWNASTIFLMLSSCIISSSFSPADGSVSVNCRNADLFHKKKGTSTTGTSLSWGFLYLFFCKK